MLKYVDGQHLLRMDEILACGTFYPTGQNDLLELLLAKFATAKNSENLNPLKASSNRCYLPENNTEDV